MEDKLTEVLVECEQNELFAGAPRQDVLVGRTGSFLADPRYVKTLLP